VINLFYIIDKNQLLEKLRIKLSRVLYT